MLLSNIDWLVLTSQICDYKIQKRQKQTKKTEAEQHVPHIKSRKNSDVHTAHCSAVILRVMNYLPFGSTWVHSLF
jgi:hypothetical protein